MTPSLDLLHRHTQDWVNDPARPFIRRNCLQNIRKSLQGGALEDVANLATDLHALCPIEAMTGVVEILAGRSAGWANLHNAMRRLYWHVRITYRLFELDPAPRKRPRLLLVNMALALAHAMADGDAEAAGWLGERLATAFPRPTFAHWARTPFEPFMAALWGRNAGVEMPSEDLGPYAPVLDAWDEGGRRLQTALHDACEYHIQRTGLINEEGYPEFTRPPYLLFPAEVLAIQRIRRDIGLPTPAIEHPLMQTPLARPPARMPATPDDLLDTILTKARQIVPEL